MSKDVRWLQRFENLEKALTRLHEAIAGVEEEPQNHLYQIALIGAYQFTFELAWKTVKDFLNFSGIDVSLPRDVIKQAFHHGFIKDGQIWIDMLEHRNLMAHVYQEEAALEASKNIRERYLHVLEQIYKDLKKRRACLDYPKQ